MGLAVEFHRGRRPRTRCRDAAAQADPNSGEHLGIAPVGRALSAPARSVPEPACMGRRALVPAGRCGRDEQPAHARSAALQRL